MPIRVTTSVHEEDVLRIQERYNALKGADEPELEVLSEHRGFCLCSPGTTRGNAEGAKMLLWRYPVHRPRAVLHFEGVPMPTEPNALSPVFNYTSFTVEEEIRVCQCMEEVFGKGHVKYYPSISSVWQSSPEQLGVFLGANVHR